MTYERRRQLHVAALTAGHVRAAGADEAAAAAEAAAVQDLAAALALATRVPILHENDVEGGYSPRVDPFAQRGAAHARSTEKI